MEDNDVAFRVQQYDVECRGHEPFWSFKGSHEEIDRAVQDHLSMAGRFAHHIEVRERYVNGTGAWSEFFRQPLSVERGNPTYLRILEYMVRLHRAKAAGYSGSKETDAWTNFRKAERYGIAARLGVLIRLSDKESRRDNLVMNHEDDQLRGENLIRTLIDTASYNLIAACLYAEDHPEWLEEAMQEVR